MGQRLNIEIHSDGRCLANAYFHWSAYTMSSAALTKAIIEEYYKASSIGGVPLAVEILQSATKAGVSPDEKERIDHDQSGCFSNIKFRECIDRNEGLISVTEEGMEDTRKWEEGRVEIDIGEETVFFDVFFSFPEEDIKEYDGEYMSEYHYKEVEDFDGRFKFQDFDAFYKDLESYDGFHTKNGEYYLKIQ